MHLHCEFDASTTRHAPEDYIRHLTINVKCVNADGDEAYTVARLAMDQILWAEAVNDGVSLYRICDGDSQELYDIYEILTGGQVSFLPELQIEEHTSHVMVLRAVVFHASVHRYRKPILDAAFKLLGEDSVAVTRQQTGGLPPSQLRQLGFEAVISSPRPLFFRHSASATPFSRRHPGGQEVDVEATPEHEAWVEEQWQKLSSRE